MKKLQNTQKPHELQTENRKTRLFDKAMEGNRYSAYKEMLKPDHVSKNHNTTNYSSSAEPDPNEEVNYFERSNINSQSKNRKTPLLKIL